jgi:hypothetical protein
MAQPQQARADGGPMRGIRQIHVNADGTVQQGDWVKFAPAGQIQFVAASGLPADINAVFTPALYGTSTAGVQPIYPDNAQNPPLNPNNNTNNMVTSYMISSAVDPNFTPQGPYCVIVGGATMPVQVDESGNLTPGKIRIPNSGLLAFNAAKEITLYATWTGGGEGPFGSQSLPLLAGLNIVHCDATDCTVTLSPTRAGANPPGTVKIGSGGTSPVPHQK